MNLHKHHPLLFVCLLLNNFGRPHLQEHGGKNLKISPQLKSLAQTQQKSTLPMALSKIDNPNMPS